MEQLNFVISKSKFERKVSLMAWWLLGSNVLWLLITKDWSEIQEILMNKGLFGLIAWIIAALCFHKVWKCLILGVMNWLLT